MAQAFLLSAFLFLLISSGVLYVVLRELKVDKKIVGLAFASVFASLSFNYLFNLLVNPSLVGSTSLLDLWINLIQGTLLNLIWFWSVALIVMFKFKDLFKQYRGRIAFALASTSAFAFFVGLLMFGALPSTLFVEDVSSAFVYKDLLFGLGDFDLQSLAVEFSRIIKLVLIYIFDLFFLLLAFKFVFDGDLKFLLMAIGLDFVASLSVNIINSFFIFERSLELYFVAVLLVYGLAIFALWSLYADKEVKKVYDKYLA